MKYEFGQTVVIALGGSIMHPGAINIDFLKSFRQFVLAWNKQGKQFVIVAGGGSIARDYQKAASEILDLSDEDKDWIGIHATRLNAHLLRTIFYKEADPVIWDSESKVGEIKYPITIASGWRPGWSTDYIALKIANALETPEAIIAGKPAYVYSTNPDKNENAKTMNKISWVEYRKLIPKKWTPGLSSPVDPVGARFANSSQMAAIIIKGTDLENFNDLLSWRDFKGTIIK